MKPALTRLAEQLPDTVPFVGPEALERISGIPCRARIGANESGFGPSPKVVTAIAAMAGDIWKYGDPETHDIKQAIARHHAVDASNVTVGGGVDGLLGLAVRLFVPEGGAVVASLGGYPTFNYHVVGFGGRLVTVPYRGDREDLEGLAEATRRENAPMVYLANPDNPMGTWWEAGEVTRFIESLPDSSMLILDEAYGETAPASALPPLDISRPNVLRMRTFSKAYGLAGLRCGYALGEASMIRAFDRVRNHFGVNRIAQQAAIVALEDQDYVRDVVQRVKVARERITGMAEANGMRALPSATNFVAVDCGADGPFALRVLQALGRRGVFVRKPAAPVLDRCIRVSVGPEREMAILEQEFPGALAEARAS